MVFKMKKTRKISIIKSLTSTGLFFLGGRRCNARGAGGKDHDQAHTVCPIGKDHDQAHSACPIDRCHNNNAVRLLRDVGGTGRFNGSMVKCATHNSKDRVDLGMQGNGIFAA